MKSRERKGEKGVFVRGFKKFWKLTMKSNSCSDSNFSCVKFTKSQFLLRMTESGYRLSSYLLCNSVVAM